MRVVITGIGGYIPSNIALAMSSSREVVGVGRATKFPFLRSVFGDRVKLVESDIADAARIGEVCRGADVVIHGAGPIVERWCAENEDEARRVIVRGTEVASEAAGRSGAMLVHLSTLSVYSTHLVREQPVCEDSELLPDTVYGSLKTEAERIAEQSGALLLRISNVFGSGAAVPAHGHVVTTIFADRAARGEAISIVGEGDEAFDFVHIDDVVRLTCELIDDPPALPAVFNVSYGSAITLRDLAALVRDEALELLGRRIEIEQRPSQRAPRPSRWLANDRVRRVAPWFPAVSTRDGMREMIQAAARAQMSAEIRPQGAEAAR
jgi:UDP-glucose 4-epimerase